MNRSCSTTASYANAPSALAPAPGNPHPHPAPRTRTRHPAPRTRTRHPAPVHPCTLAPVHPDYFSNRLSGMNHIIATAKNKASEIHEFTKDNPTAMM